MKSALTEFSSQQKCYRCCPSKPRKKRLQKPRISRVTILVASSLFLPLNRRVHAFVAQSSMNPLQIVSSIEQTKTHQAICLHRRRTRLFYAVKEEAENEEPSKRIEMSSAASDDPTTDGPKNDFRFASPLLEFGYPPAVKEFEDGKTFTKPLLLYVPGFDGTYLSAFFQYPELHSNFEVRCLVSTMGDRSSFDELKQSTLEFITKESSHTSEFQDFNEVQKGILLEAVDKNDEEAKDKLSFSTFVSGMLNQQKQGVSSAISENVGRPLYLVGESFGGILACEVALALLENTDINFQGLVLINAATCYDRSRLAAEGPPITRLPKFLYAFGLMKLLPMFLDKVSFPQFLAIIQGNALPSLIDNPTREAYMGRLAFSLPTLLKFMPQETFQWRLEEWLAAGCRRMETTLPLLADQAERSGLKTLIVAGENDLTLPSIAEAERLAQLLPNTQVHVVPAVGHANTCGTCLDLAAEMRSHFPELRKRQGTERLSSDQNSVRTTMKEVALQGDGIYYGMEPRYDGNKIGLSPLKYWAKEYYRTATLQD